MLNSAVPSRIDAKKIKNHMQKAVNDKTNIELLDYCFLASEVRVTNRNQFSSVPLIQKYIFIEVTCTSLKFKRRIKRIKTE